MKTPEEIIAELKAQLKRSEEKRLRAEAHAEKIKKQAKKLEKERDDYRDQFELRDVLARSLAVLCVSAIRDGSPLGDDINQAELDRLQEITLQAE